MKKLWIALGVLLGAALIGVIGYVAFFMEEPAASASTSSASSSEQEEGTPSGQPKLDVKKQAESPADVLESLDYETARNPDTVGWIKIPGTDINNSVVQSHDNIAYLRRNERGQEDVYGCYFADFESSIGPREVLSPNTVIYGHSDLHDNPEGPRFSQLFRFAGEDFARNTPYIEFSTLDGFMDWEVFAVFYTDIAFNYIRTNLTGPEMTALAAEAVEKSLYDYGVTVGENDKILTLSTCTIKYGPEDNSHRFVVMAKLVPEGAALADMAELTVREITN